MASAPASPWSKVRAAAERAAAAQIAREEVAADALRAQMLATLRPLVAQASHLYQRVWVFGSYAWGKPREESDLDLLVDGDADRLATFLMEHLRLPLHVFQLDEAPESLRERVLRDGLLL